MNYKSVLILHDTNEPFASITTTLNIIRTWQTNINILVFSTPAAASRIVTATASATDSSLDSESSADIAKSENRLQQIRELTNSLNLSIEISHHYTIDDNFKGILEKAVMYSDLVTMSHWYDLSSGVQKLCFDTVLIDHSKPVFITARQPEKTSLTLDNIVVAWHEDVNAMKAVNSTLPILHHAKEIHLVTVNDSHTNENLDAIKAYFDQHALKAEFKKVPTSGRFVSHALVDAVKDIKPDLLIMGAFGHSQLREKLFHGTTHDVLEELADTNLVLCHA